MTHILGGNIKPGDIILLRGCREVVESCRWQCGYNHLRLSSGLAWPVAGDEELIKLGQVTERDLAGMLGDGR